MPVFGPIHPPPVKEGLVPDFAAFAAQNPWVGPPLGGVQQLPDGGYMQLFQNATAYALMAGIPHEVHGLIRDKYHQLGGPQGFLGYPSTNESGCPDGVGRFNHFAGGSIYYHPLVGPNAYQVGGLIEQEWNSLGGPQYGYPSTDESPCSDGVGRFNHFTTVFTDGTTALASIYWTPSTNAHEVRGAIHAAWAALGYETSWLGYPISDEYDFSPPNRRSDFQNGSVVWDPVLGNHFWPQVFTFNAPDISTPSGIALGGNAALQLFSDGTVHFSGHLHDSGFVGYNYDAVLTIKDAQGRAYTASQSGSTSGSIDSSAETGRDSDWDLWGSSVDVSTHWADIRSGGVGGGQISESTALSAKQILDIVLDIIGAIGLLVMLAFGSKKPTRSNGDDDVAYDPPGGFPPGNSANSPQPDSFG
jgi:LGFP repeat-containing protein